MKLDRLVLILLWREMLASLRSMRRRDLVWLCVGGPSVAAYGAATAVVTLRATAGALRQSSGLWLVGIPAGAFLLGSAAGLGVARLALARAHAPFMKALPVSSQARRHMAAVAAHCIGAVLALAFATLIGLSCAVVAKPYAFAWAFGAGVLFAIGSAVGVYALPPRLTHRPADQAATELHPARRRQSLSKLGRLDRAKPAWLGSWAWNLRRGAVSPSWRLAVAGVVAGLVGSVSATASLAHQHAAPGAFTALVGGLAIFMLSLRCHPLVSPVLRTAPIGFGHMWLRLLRLPFLLSAAFFALPATAALAAEPASWPLPAASGLWLVLLNGAYAVFAAYFSTAPLLAAFSFLAAVACAGYESIEYGGTVLLGFAALLAWLWYLARQRYYHG